jgi:hypothetical protein
VHLAPGGSGAVPQILRHPVTAPAPPWAVARPTWPTSGAVDWDVQRGKLRDRKQSTQRWVASSQRASSQLGELALKPGSHT